MGEDVGLVEVAEETVGVVGGEDMASRRKGAMQYNCAVVNAESARRLAVLPVPSHPRIVMRSTLTDHHNIRLNMILTLFLQSYSSYALEILFHLFVPLCHTPGSKYTKGIVE